jgi:hypothetical protein
MLKGNKIKSGIALFICLLMIFALAGCGGSGQDAVEDSRGEINPDYSTGQPGSSDGIREEEMKGNEDSFGGQGLPADLAPTGSTPLKYGENVKLIYTAYINLQTTEFEKAELQLVELVTASEGYFEASYVDRGSYYAEESYRYGSYTIRVPAEKYEAFLSAVGENCHVVSLNKTTTDVGTEYFDTEARLNTLKAKQERLLALLNQATTMSDIIELENSLSNTQYEIDMYASTLNRYDSLVGYSTVQVSLEEVARLGSGVDEEEGFFASLVRSLVNGFNNFIDGVEGLVMWFAYNIIVILIALAIFLMGRKWYIKRRKEKGPFFPNFNLKRTARKAKKIAEHAMNKDVKEEEE